LSLLFFCLIIINVSDDKYLKLHDKFSELIPTTNTIQCDMGLYDIILEMLAAIKIYQDANLGRSDLIPTIFNHIKSEYGVLNIDYNGGDEVVKEIINFTKRLSFKTCEICGKMGNLYCSTKWMHWSNKKTLCKDHAIKLFYYTIT